MPNVVTDVEVEGTKGDHTELTSVIVPIDDDWSYFILVLLSDDDGPGLPFTS